MEFALCHSLPRSACSSRRFLSRWVEESCSSADEILMARNLFFHLLRFESVSADSSGLREGRLAMVMRKLTGRRLCM